MLSIRDISPSAMVYTQARLDEALNAFRESKIYLARRGLKSGNLEAHLGRKYEFRKQPPETAFAPRPTLWHSRDDDSDGEFDPSNDRKKGRKKTQEPKSARVQRKPKLSEIHAEGSSNDSDQKKRRKPKGLTWSQGRRQGHSMIEILKFTKPECLESLQTLLTVYGPGSAKMPQEQEVNVFSANEHDSGFTLPSSSDHPNGEVFEEKSQVENGDTEKGDPALGLLSGGSTFIDPATGLATPRSSIGSLDDLTKGNIPAFIADDGEYVGVRGLRTRAVPLKPHPNQRRSCINCKDEQRKCSLVKDIPGFEGPCHGCDTADLPCRVDEGDELRIGTMLRKALERKRSLEDKEEEPSRSKRRNIGSNVYDFPESDDEDDRRLGKSMLKKKIKSKTGEQSKQASISRMINFGKTSAAKKDQSGLGLSPLDTSLANSIERRSSNCDSGYVTGTNTGFGTPPFTKTPPSFAFTNTLETAISLSDTSSVRSQSRSPAPYLEITPTTTINTSWAHPMSFQHRPLQSGHPCDFCADFRYGIFGLGNLTVEVAWDNTERGYIEMGTGHRAQGREPTRMCTTCALERLRIRFCGCGHDPKGKSKAGELAQTVKHELVQIPAWQRNAAGWAVQLTMKKHQEGYSTKASLPPCALCMKPAGFRCGRMQERGMALQPLKEGQSERQGCGLKLCGGCRDVAEREGWGWTGVLAGVGKYRRADAEFLFAGSLMERSWGEHLNGVGLH